MKNSQQSTKNNKQPKTWPLRSGQHTPGITSKSPSGRRRRDYAKKIMNDPLIFTA